MKASALADTMLGTLTTAAPEGLSTLAISATSVLPAVRCSSTSVQKIASTASAGRGMCAAGPSRSATRSGSPYLSIVSQRRCGTCERNEASVAPTSSTSALGGTTREASLRVAASRARPTASAT